MESEDEWMEVINLQKLVNFSRKVIYYNFDDENKNLSDKSFLEKIEKISTEESIKEMEDVLPFKEVETIFGNYLYRRKDKSTNKKGWFMKEKDYNTILEELAERMVSNIVRNLVKKGLVEMAFDEEKNEFVFWPVERKK
jgi:hypothetical protein